MNEDCLKLTTYFSERDRIGSRLLADTLLDFYGHHGVHSSILLRGISGFGLKHHLHTDQLLTLSEDLPAIAVAVDTHDKINTVLPYALALKERGLLTLERAQMITGDLHTISMPEALGEASKLTVYVGRQERVYRTKAFAAICELLHRRGISGATVLLGVDGTNRGVRERASFFGRNADVPMMIIAVGTGPDIEQVVPALGGLLEDSMITIERVRVCKRDGKLIAAPHELPGTDEHGLPLWQKLMIHTTETARYQGRPVHRALVEALRQSNVAGATCVRGVWGFRGDHEPHGDKLLQLYRHTPVITIVVDTPERIMDAFGIVDEITSEAGLVTSEMVPAARAATDAQVRGGTDLARHEF